MEHERRRFRWWSEPVDINHSSPEPRCRLCKDSPETVQNIPARCRMLAGKQLERMWGVATSVIAVVTSSRLQQIPVLVQRTVPGTAKILIITLIVASMLLLKDFRKRCQSQTFFFFLNQYFRWQEYAYVGIMYKPAAEVTSCSCVVKMMLQKSAALRVIWEGLVDGMHRKIMCNYTDLWIQTLCLTITSRNINYGTPKEILKSVQ